MDFSWGFHQPPWEYKGILEYHQHQIRMCDGEKFVSVGGWSIRKTSAWDAQEQGSTAQIVHGMLIGFFLGIETIAFYNLNHQHHIIWE
jgi:hypothetical protein